MAAVVQHQAISRSRDQKNATVRVLPTGGQGQSLESVRTECKTNDGRYENFAIQVSQTDECPFERSERQVQPGRRLQVSVLRCPSGINPACVKLGLATVVDTELLDWREKITKSGMIWQIVSKKVTVTIIDSDSGEMLQPRASEAARTPETSHSRRLRLRAGNMPSCWP